MHSPAKSSKNRKNDREKELVQQQQATKKKHSKFCVERIFVRWLCMLDVYVEKRRRRKWGRENVKDVHRPRKYEFCLFLTHTHTPNDTRSYSVSDGIDNELKKKDWWKRVIFLLALLMPFYWAWNQILKYLSVSTATEHIPCHAHFIHRHEAHGAGAVRLK